MGLDAEMYIKTAVPVPEETRHRLAWELSSAFYHDTFHQCPENDHRSIVATADPLMMEVALSTRYYGEGYERGNLPEILSVAKWLYAKIPNAVIYYGHDCDEGLGDVLTQEFADGLWRHFVEHGHRPYVNGFGRGVTTTPCPRCKQPTCAGTWSGGNTYGRCTGCGWDEYEASKS